MLGLALLIGLTLGLLGGGGSILAVPTLVYAVGLEAKPAITTSLLVVGATSAVALLPHARAGNVHWRIGAVFGTAGMAGAFAGGQLARFLSGELLLLLFAAMMVGTALAMWRGRSPNEPPAHGVATRPTVKIIVDGFCVGLATGLVGAGGGFLVVPALVLLGGFPIPAAVGTSLLVIAMKSLAGFLGYVSHVAVDYPLAAGFSAAAVVGSFAGARLVALVDPDRLRRGFSVFVLAMAGFILYGERAVLEGIDIRLVLGGLAAGIAALAAFLGRRMNVHGGIQMRVNELNTSRRGRLLAAALVTLGGLGCSTEPAASVDSLSPAEVLAFVDSERTPLILDVRTPGEFATGHVPGAVNIPFGEIATRLAEVEPYRDRGVAVYCESGRRARDAERTLRAAGFGDVRQIEGHMSAWRASNRPVEK